MTELQPKSTGTRGFGTVDENGVLWKSTRVGKFIERPSGAPEVSTTWEALLSVCGKYKLQPAVGWRPVERRETGADGMEKLVLGNYQWLSYGEYFTRIEHFGAGLVKLGMQPKDNLIIFADTQYQWMLSAFGAWRQGLTVGTIYATLGEEGALCPLRDEPAIS
jgi:long-chain acyl-CoA synthetase